MIEDVIGTTEYCRHSLMCRHVCPVGNLTHRETLTPHGWAQLVASERRGMIAWNEDTVEALYACADCGNCRSHCATSQPLPAALAAARAQVVEQDRAPAVVYELREKLQRWETPFEEQSPEPVSGQGEVALLASDEAVYRQPSALEAAREVLSAVGVEPVLVGIGRSNGYMASSLGLPGVAEALARATLRELEESGAKRLLVLSPGDFFAFGQMHEERLGVSWPAQIELEEVTTFLADRLDAGALSLADGGRSDGRPGGPYAYVDPTHTPRATARTGAPRRLLRAGWPDREPVELFWRHGRAYPCGDLALSFTQPELARSLTQARLEDARNAGAQQVVTDAPGSLYHLRQHSGEASEGDGLEVKGLYEVLAARLA